MWSGFFIFAFLKKNIMGKGDKKTAKGKRFKGSFGKARPHKKAAVKTATANA